MENKLSKALHLALAAVTLLAALALIWACADIYIEGNLPENIQNGVHLVPVFSREAVGLRLRALTPLFILWALLLIAAFIFARPAGGKKPPKPRPAGPFTAKKPGALIPGLILAAAIVFILLGVMNGGAKDVLIKAVNICTECIGLG